MIRALDLVGRQKSLDPLGKALQRVVDAGLATLGPNRRAVANLLHGTWIGHPLHPILTDVAIGGYAATVTLDLVDQVAGDERLAGGADVALGLGVAGALGAAVTGLNDWQHTSGEARRLGVVHALLNGTGTTIFVVSLLARLTGSRRLGRRLAALGFGVSMTAAYIGGHLVFGKQIGVHHAALIEGPDDFTPVVADSELEPDRPRLAEVGGERFVLVRHGGGVYALADTCSHLGGPLAQGTLEDGGIVCPWHASRFNLGDGRVLDGPATFAQPCFAVRIRDGQLEVGPRQR